MTVTLDDDVRTTTVVLATAHLELVKRQMYGRGKVDLLRARMVQPA